MSTSIWTLILFIVVIIVIYCHVVLQQHRDYVLRHGSFVRQYDNYQYEDKVQDNLFVRYHGFKTIDPLVDAVVQKLNCVHPVENAASLDLYFAALFGGPFVFPSRTWTRDTYIDLQEKTIAEKTVPLCYKDKTQKETFASAVMEALKDVAVTDRDVNWLMSRLWT